MPEFAKKGLNGEWGIIGYIIGIAFLWAVAKLIYGEKWGTIITIIFTIMVILSRI